MNTKIVVPLDGNEVLGYSEPTFETVTDANPIGADESPSVFNNTGDGEKTLYTLPAAAEGLRFTFHNIVSYGSRITAGAGDTIRLNDAVSKAAGYIEATGLGASVVLVCLDGTQWIAESIVGVWTVETS